MLTLLLNATLAGAPGCTVEDAVYALRSDTPVTARFHAVDTGPDWLAGVVMQIDVAASGRTYWWLPFGGGSSGVSYLASVSAPLSADWSPPRAGDADARPLGDIPYWAFDADYMFQEGYPIRGAPAPAHFFLPELGDALWYRQMENRDSAARQFFDLVSCGPDGPQDNAPTEPPAE